MATLYNETKELIIALRSGLKAANKQLRTPKFSKAYDRKIKRLIGYLLARARRLEDEIMKKIEEGEYLYREEQFHAYLSQEYFFLWMLAHNTLNKINGMSSAVASIEPLKRLHKLLFDE